jgi:hypothetical protein
VSGALQCSGELLTPQQLGEIGDRMIAAHPVALPVGFSGCAFARATRRVGTAHAAFTGNGLKA